MLSDLSAFKLTPPSPMFLFSGNESKLSFRLPKWKNATKMFSAFWPLKSVQRTRYLSSFPLFSPKGPKNDTSTEKHVQCLYQKSVNVTLCCLPYKIRSGDLHVFLLSGIVNYVFPDRPKPWNHRPMWSVLRPLNLHLFSSAIQSNIYVSGGKVYTL